MAYKSNQSYATTDKDLWEKLVEQEQAKVNAAGVQGFNSYQDMLDYAGTQSYSQYGQVQPDGNVVGGVQRPVASGLAGADEQLLSDAAYATVQNAKNMYGQATTRAEKDAWHNVAEQERAKAGYSGGTDGSMYLAAAPQNYTLQYGVPEEENQGLFQLYGQWYDNPYGIAGNTGYSSGYGGQLDAMVDAILGREPFSYNKDTDPLYQQYADSYTRGGQRAMQDVLAQISARTGGLASSYATGASQQAYNNYMAGLADKVPELYQIAYGMYQDEIANDRADLDMLLGIDNTYYDRYRDTVADNQWQQQFNYNAAVDQRDFDYNAAINDREWEYMLAQDAMTSAIANDAAAPKKTGGSYNNGGLTKDQVKALQAALGVSQDGLYGTLSKDAAGGLSAEEAYAKFVGTGMNEDDGPTYTTVAGIGRVTWQELENLVDKGAVIESYNEETGKYTYRKNRNYNS